MALPYTKTADDESFTGQPLTGQTWRRWASNAQHFAQSRGHIAAAGYCYHPLHLVGSGTPQYIEIAHQAAPWETKYRVRAVVACRVPLDGLTLRLYVSSYDTAGGSASAAQPGAGFSLMSQVEIQDGSQPTGTPPPAVVQWPILEDTPPQLIRMVSGWVVHEPSSALKLLRDRVLRITCQWIGAPVGAYLAGYIVEGYDDTEVI